MRTTNTRRDEILKRAGRDPVEVDKRPTSEILNDSLPYEKWAKQALVLTRAGYRTWVDLLKDRHDKRAKPK